jgi:NAD(P)-dependent dehydrogenase (short-subunit alcohol dehydrogenase family)
MEGIEGKVAIVTGGGSGIGRATAVRFAEAGAKVLVADIVEDGGEETVRMIEEMGGEAAFQKTDVSKASDVEAMVDAAVETFDQLDFAFNNAGIEGTTAPSDELSEEDWQRVLDINLTGVWLGMKYEIPKMLEIGGGAVVNTSSVAGLLGFPELAPYVASKHGVVGVTKTAALEYSVQGVRVNAVCPGVIDTPMVARTFENNPEMREQLETSEPIGRLGEPEEVANAVVWLCSDEASFVTGVPLPVDGGYAIQ